MGLISEFLDIFNAFLFCFFLVAITIFMNLFHYLFLLYLQAVFNWRIFTH